MSEGKKDFEKRKAIFRTGILRDARLTLAARIIGYEIADLINARSGDAWPSQQYLAGLTGIEIRTVRRASADLESAGWFMREIDGRSWRYIPNYGRLDVIPDKMSAIDTGHLRRKHRTIFPKTPDSNVPLSSLREPTTEPMRGCGQPSAQSHSTSNDKGSGRQDREVATLADQSEAITRRAQRGGAPVFVFENSEPWRAWVEYRQRNGIPGNLPTRQRMHLGRWRTGWDAPTLYPPGYSSVAKGGAA